MAAIGGILQFDGPTVDAVELSRLAQEMGSRGPDGVTHWSGDALGLVHLAFHLTPESIFEQQPLVAASGRLVLVADVRLDNRAELMAALAGYAELPEPVVTDAALLLAAYERWGTDCVAHLLGDFVFALWDRVERTLFLARDALGAYSLCYAQIAGRLVFASEVSAVLAMPGVAAEIDEDTLLRTLAMMPTHAEHSFFRDIRYLPPAHCLLVSPGGQRQWRYWQLDGEKRLVYSSDAEYVDQFLELLHQATAARLRSVGAVGLSLSGGFDSTLLAACASRLLPELVPEHPRLHSFSYVFDQHAACDERAYIDPVVAQYGLAAQYIPSDDAWSFADLGRTPVARDYLWTNCYAQLPRRVAAAAQNTGCRLLLDGHFGDTLCSGYSLFAADLMVRGEWRALAGMFGGHGRWLRYLPELFRFGLLPLVPWQVKGLYRRVRPLAEMRWIKDSARLHALRSEAHREGAMRCAGLMPSRVPRCRSLLHPSWPNGMAAVRGFLYSHYGVEKVSPYFDRRLVEFVLAIPAEQIARPGEPRRLQRLAMERLLPQKVWQRRTKTSYEPLLREGMVRRERESILALLAQPLAVDYGWVDGDWLRRALSASSWSDEVLYTLSTCVGLELWLRALKGENPSK